MARDAALYDIYVLIGEQKIITFQLFEDDDQTIPHVLTGCTVTVVLSPPSLSNAAPTTLTSGNGLSIDATSGLVAMSTPTSGWVVGRGRWYMELVDAGGNTSYPVRGALFIGNP